MKLLEKQKANGASTDHDAANKSASGMFLEVKNDADLVAEAIASSTAASDMAQPPSSPCTSSLPPMPHYNQQEAGCYQPHAPPVPLISPPPTASSYSSSYGSGGSFPPLSATSSSFPTPTTSSSHSSTLHSPRYHPYQFPSSASSSSSAYPTPTSYSSSSSSSYMDSRALDYMQARSATFPHSSSGSSGSYSYLSSSAPVAVASPMHLPTSSPLYSPTFLGTSARQPPPFPPASLVSPRFGTSPPGVDARSQTPAPNLRPILSRTSTSSSSATCASSTPTVSPYAASSSSIGPPVPLEPSTTQRVTGHAPGQAPRHRRQDSRIHLPAERGANRRPHPSRCLQQPYRILRHPCILLVRWTRRHHRRLGRPLGQRQRPGQRRSSCLRVRPRVRLRPRRHTAIRTMET
ncbi:hypothetical protein BCR44DRAFT_1176243 [Catenaria anguillulae PL171]|uniref:Uncharacterized protein n=1 Tax=Catenaria anguillulae PL171 TaxID=765915 RepID=A0A1Y2I3M4_9FUNG|nr:hypothetical protein BCR44DRAFT_1176243 [Catenaria anguillulae PL171]